MPGDDFFLGSPLRLRDGLSVDVHRDLRGAVPEDTALIVFRNTQLAFRCHEVQVTVFRVVIE